MTSSFDMEDDDAPKAQDPREAYQEVLSQLHSSSKPAIMLLTKLAKEYRTEHALDIVNMIERRMRHAPADRKLPCLHLLDSIVKNHPLPYTELFQRSIVHHFALVFGALQDVDLRMAMYRLRCTWNDVFSPARLRKLDVRVRLEHDPMWPLAEVSVARPPGVRVKQDHGGPVAGVSVERSPGARVKHYHNPMTILADGSSASARSLGVSASRPFTLDPSKAGSVGTSRPYVRSASLGSDTPCLSSPIADPMRPEQSPLHWSRLRLSMSDPMRPEVNNASLTQGSSLRSPVSDARWTDEVKAEAGYSPVDIHGHRPVFECYPPSKDRGRKRGHGPDEDDVKVKVERAMVAKVEDAMKRLKQQRSSTDLKDAGQLRGSSNTISCQKTKVTPAHVYRHVCEDLEAMVDPTTMDLLSTYRSDDVLRIMHSAFCKSFKELVQAGVFIFLKETQFNVGEGVSKGPPDASDRVKIKVEPNSDKYDKLNVGEASSYKGMSSAQEGKSNITIPIKLEKVKDSEAASKDQPAPIMPTNVEIKKEKVDDESELVRIKEEPMDDYRPWARESESSNDHIYLLLDEIGRENQDIKRENMDVKRLNAELTTRVERLEKAVEEILSSSSSRVSSSDVGHK